MGISILRNPVSEEVRQSGKYCLFVEGEPDSVDVVTLGRLFDDQIRVERLGPSFSVRSAAEALHATHPYYFFLIDRDHQSDAEVESAWQRFPNPETANILIWRRREIENYFLEPQFLMTSRYYQDGVCDLAVRVAEIAERRLYLDAANSVLISVRENLKGEIKCIRLVLHLADADSYDHALASLLKSVVDSRYDEKASLVLQQIGLDTAFRQRVDEYTGGSPHISCGVGRWVELMKGKKIFHEILSLPCFKIVDVNGTQLAGAERVNAFCRDLLAQRTSSLPADFQQLRAVVLGRVRQEGMAGL